MSSSQPLSLVQLMERVQSSLLLDDETKYEATANDVLDKLQILITSLLATSSSSNEGEGVAGVVQVQCEWLWRRVLELYKER
jgi:hypothetical protein